VLNLFCAGSYKEFVKPPVFGTPGSSEVYYSAYKTGMYKSCVLQICLVLNKFELIPVWLNLVDFQLPVYLVYMASLFKTGMLPPISKTMSTHRKN